MSETTNLSKLLWHAERHVEQAKKSLREAEEYLASVHQAVLDRLPDEVDLDLEFSPASVHPDWQTVHLSTTIKPHQGRVWYSNRFVKVFFEVYEEDVSKTFLRLIAIEICPSVEFKASPKKWGYIVDVPVEREE